MNSACCPLWLTAELLLLKKASVLQHAFCASQTVLKSDIHSNIYVPETSQLCSPKLLPKLCNFPGLLPHSNGVTFKTYAKQCTSVLFLLLFSTSFHLSSPTQTFSSLLFRAAHHCCFCPVSLSSGGN